MSEAAERLKPYLDDLANGKITVSAIAENFGLSHATISAQIKRYFPNNVVGKGNSHPATTDTMRQAVAECEDPRVNIADVARKYGLKYLNLATRVKRRREKLYQQAMSEKAAKEAVVVEEPYQSEDLAYVKQFLNDPVIVSKVAAIMRTLST